MLAAPCLISESVASLSSAAVETCLASLGAANFDVLFPLHCTLPVASPCRVSLVLSGQESATTPRSFAISTECCSCCCCREGLSGKECSWPCAAKPLLTSPADGCSSLSKTLCSVCSWPAFPAFLEWPALSGVCALQLSSSSEDSVKSMKIWLFGSIACPTLTRVRHLTQALSVTTCCGTCSLSCTVKLL